jgi:hypothetical protein
MIVIRLTIVCEEFYDTLSEVYGAREAEIQRAQEIVTGFLRNILR